MNFTRQYKMMIAASLLVPVACHADELQETEMRIKELEDERWKIEDDLAQLKDKIIQEACKYSEYKDTALVFWKPFLDEQDKEASLENFLDDLVRTLDAGGDIDAIFERAPWMDQPARRVMVLSASFKALLVNRICNQYDQLAQEFIKISRKLNHLR